MGKVKDEATSKAATLADREESRVHLREQDATGLAEAEMTLKSDNIRDG
jgi:hypothetical protein